MLMKQMKHHFKKIVSHNYSSHLNSVHSAVRARTPYCSFLLYHPHVTLFAYSGRVVNLAKHGLEVLQYLYTLNVLRTRYLVLKMERHNNRVLTVTSRLV
jgi:hypothetical protein